MDHQFGHLHRVGSSVELCPPLEATVTGDIAGDVASPSKRCIGYKVQQVPVPRRKNKSELELHFLGCYTATSSQANATEG